MREEFHGENYGDGTYKRKILYGWGTISVNIWLPSLSELIGIDPNNYADGLGTYYSAMQGMNASTNYYVDLQGGTQFAYFEQFNASGGGEGIWTACRQESSWLRSSAPWDTVTVWRISNTERMDTPVATVSYAVHPAGIQV